MMSLANNAIASSLAASLTGYLSMRRWLNQEMIAQEELFDGFYAICTDLEDDAPAIIKANAGRWIIENGLHGSAGFRTDKQIVTRK